MKLCQSKGNCKTEPNTPLADHCFERTAGKGRNLRGKCRKCRQRSSVKTYDYAKPKGCNLMYFMAGMLWNESNAAVISAQCSQPSLI